MYECMNVCVADLNAVIIRKCDGQISASSLNITFRFGKFRVWKHAGNNLFPP
jgi:hypothetical protein